MELADRDGAPSPIRVGIVGLSAGGGWAARSHLPALRALDGLELSALAASTAERAADAAAEYGVPAGFGSAQAMAESGAVDLAVIAVRVPQHVALVEPFLRAGVPVLCEWPLAATTAEASGLAELSEQTGARGFVGLQGRSAPTLRHLRDLIAEGRIGSVLSTSMIGSGMAWGPTTDSRSVYLYDRSNGATLLTIPFGHAIDVLQMCLGPIAWVTAVTAIRCPAVTNAATGETVDVTSPDQVLVQGELTDGATVSVHYRGGSRPGRNFLWEIDGTEGRITVESETGHLQHGKVRITLATSADRTGHVVELPSSYTDGLDRDALANGESVAHAYRGIRDDLATGTTTTADFRHAVAVHRLLDVITDASTSGQRRTVAL